MLIRNLVDMWFWNVLFETGRLLFICVFVMETMGFIVRFEVFITDLEL